MYKSPMNADISKELLISEFEKSNYRTKMPKKLTDTSIKQKVKYESIYFCRAIFEKELIEYLSKKIDNNINK